MWNHLHPCILDTKKQAAYFIKHKHHLFESWMENITRCFGNCHKKEYISENFFLFLASTKHHFRHYILHDDSIVLTSCAIKHNTIYNDYEIHEVCTNPSFQHQGLCKELLTSVLEYLKTQRAHSASIYCIKNNAAACQCYCDVFGSSIHDTQETKAFRKIFEYDQ